MGLSLKGLPPVGRCDGGRCGSAGNFQTRLPIIEGRAQAREARNKSVAARYSPFQALRRSGQWQPPNLNSAHRSILIVELPDAFAALKTLLFGQQQELPKTWFE